MKYSIAGLAVAIVLSGLLAFWLIRDPWDQPQAFIFERARILNTEDRSEATDLEEEYGFFADLIVEMQGEIEAAASEGYLLADPGAGTVTVHLLGFTVQAPFPDRGEEVAFDVTASGGGPLSLRRDGRRAIVEAPMDGFGEGLVVSMEFSPAKDVSDRKARQVELAAANDAAIAEWEASLTSVRAAVEAGPEIKGRSWRHVLPGWKAAVLLPDWASFGFAPDFPQTVFSDPTDAQRQFVVNARLPGKAQQSFDAERIRMLEGPENEREALMDEPDAVIVARMGAGFTGLFQAGVEDIDYILYVESHDIAMIREVWAAAKSLSSEPLTMNPGLDRDFDALALVRERGMPVEVKPGFKDEFQERVARQFEIPALLSQSSGDRITEFQPGNITDDWNDWGIPEVVCTPIPSDEAPLSRIHETLMTDSFGGLRAAFTTDQIALHVASGDFAANRVTEPDPSPEFPRTTPQWFEDDPERTVGAEGPLYYLYFARLMGRVKLVCGAIGENPLALRLAEQMTMSLPMPQVDPVPDWVVQDYRSYTYASDFAWGLIKVTDGSDKYWLLNAQGERLIDRSFGYLWAHRDAGVFEGGDSDAKVGVWNRDGVQLLAETFDDISDISEPDRPMIRASQGDKRTNYLISQNKVVELPD